MPPLLQVADLPDYLPYGSPAPIQYERVYGTEGGALPSFCSAGTGGFEGVRYILDRSGYRLFELISLIPPENNTSVTLYAELVQEIREGFGRTLSHLPAVFGVSRQTLYNWASGEHPKVQHQAKLVQLAEAAKAFKEARVKPTALMLDRTISKGQSFVELLSKGADGREMAQKLIRISQRGASAREKLDALLGERGKSRLEVSDMGRRHFPDEA